MIPKLFTRQQLSEELPSIYRCVLADNVGSFSVLIRCERHDEVSISIEFANGVVHSYIDYQTLLAFINPIVSTVTLVINMPSNLYRKCKEDSEFTGKSIEYLILARLEHITGYPHYTDDLMYWKTFIDFNDAVQCAVYE